MIHYLNARKRFDTTKAPLIAEENIVCYAITDEEITKGNTFTLTPQNYKDVFYWLDNKIEEKEWVYAANCIEEAYYGKGKRIYEAYIPKGAEYYTECEDNFGMFLYATKEIIITDKQLAGDGISKIDWVYGSLDGNNITLQDFINALIGKTLTVGNNHHIIHSENISRENIVENNGWEDDGICLESSIIDLRFPLREDGTYDFVLPMGPQNAVSLIKDGYIRSSDYYNGEETYYELIK